MEAIKILVTATTFPRWQNDTEPAFVYELSKRLADAGFEIMVLAPHFKGAKKEEMMGKVRVVRFPYFFERLEKLCYEGGIIPNIKRHWYARLLIPLLTASELIYTIKTAKKEKISVIHAHWIVPQGFVAAIAKKLTGVPYIATAHAGDVFPLKNRLFRLAAGIALKNAACCTANSTATKQAVLKVKNISNIEIIPMGVDLAEFTPKKRSNELRKRTGGKIILAAGRMAEKKGFTHLIEAMPAVIKKIPDAKLVLIGEGPEKELLEEKAKELKLEGKTFFEGKATKEGLAKWYASSDVFVLPSIITKEGDTEGLGLVLLEAIASGLPVIGSNVGGIPDIIKHEETGLLVREKQSDEIAQAIIKILTDRKLRSRLTKNATRHVRENYSWETVTERFAKLLRETHASGGKGQG
ncbi:glycosyltransferase [Candidatus Woesearchaeota archaeon]|nr:glycosyltransferase [Candidatus Woesearchaeota archaeon]